jgi:glycerophosphoryl diester phosphodiesterase
MLCDYNWLTSLPIAHRGLWGGDQKENSLIAYQKAMDAGFAIEVDLYQTADGKIVCFHDKTLKRMCGVDKAVYECDLATIKSLKLDGGDQTVPTLQELLSLTDGKVPLLIELKNHPSKNYLQTVVDILKNYKGQFAIQSFNPLYIYRLRKLAPDFICGILGTPNAKEEKPFIRWLVKSLALNFLAKPQFISYDFTALPLPKRKTKKLPVLAWTVTSQQDFDKIKSHCNNIIFENFIPQ